METQARPAAGGETSGAETTSGARRSLRDWMMWALILQAALNSLCYPLITVGERFAPHLTFATLRAVVAGLALATAAAIGQRPLPRSLRTWLMLAAIGLGTTSLGSLGMYDAAALIAPGLASVIGNSQPLVAAIIAGLFLHERLQPLQRLGLLLGFLGIFVISLPHFDGVGRVSFTHGIAFLALAVVGVAVGNVLMKAVSERVDPLVAMASQALFGAIPLAIAAGLGEQPATLVWSGRFVESLLGLGLLGSALPSWIWFTVLARMPLSRANAFNFLTPLIGFLLGVEFFGERVGLAALLGLALTVGGVVLVERNAREPSNTSAP